MRHSKQCIIIMGAPGVGKTSTARQLLETIPKAQWVDADDLWRIHPFEVDNHNKTMVESNIKHIYQSFIDNPNLDTMIFTWVIPHQTLLNNIHKWFNQTDNLTVILTCDKTHYRQRLSQDNRNIKRQLENYDTLHKSYQAMGLPSLDTTHLTINDTVEQIHHLWTSNTPLKG